MKNHINLENKIEEYLDFRGLLKYEESITWSPNGKEKEKTYHYFLPLQGIREETAFSLNLELNEEFHKAFNKVVSFYETERIQTYTDKRGYRQQILQFVEEITLSKELCLSLLDEIDESEDNFFFIGYEGGISSREKKQCCNPLMDFVTSIYIINSVKEDPNDNDFWSKEAIYEFINNQLKKISDISQYENHNPLQEQLDSEEQYENIENYCIECGELLSDEEDGLCELCKRYFT